MAAAPLPNLALHPDTNPETVDSVKVTADWIHSLNKLLENKNWSAFPNLFVDECWWRDVIALGWDFTSKNGPQAVSDFVETSTHGFSKLEACTGALAPHLSAMGGQYIESGFTFTTKFGSGRGILRLVNTAIDDWKAWMVYTNLEHLNRNEPASASVQNGESPLQVLVVGAGHSGLILAAWLKHLGLKYRIIDSNVRLGDNWRLRYHTLQAHTPSWGDQHPFMDFPVPWPEFMTREQISDWQEHYAQQLELNVELKTTLKAAHFDHASKTYEAELSGPNGVEKLTAKHVVLATGLYSSEPRQLNLPNEKLFEGEVYHTSRHKSAVHIDNLSNKRVVVIGTGTSAHDVAQDFVEHGAKEVTMVQRGGIYSSSRKSILATLLGVYQTPGITIQEGDLMSSSMPFPVLRTIGPGMTHAMQSMDNEMLEGLKKAGLGIRPANDNGDSFVTQFAVKTGSFYVDQGANQMIIDGRIRIVRDENGVVDLNEQGVILAGGTRVPAEVLVLATGFQKAKRAAEKLMDPEVLQRVGDLGDIDREGERIGWWRPTGFPNFWYMAGNFAWGRMFAKTLAFQLQAIEDGRNENYYESVEKQDPDLRVRAV